MRTIKFCSVVFGVTSRLSIINNIYCCMALCRPSPAINKHPAKYYNLYSTVEMSTTLDSPAVIDAKARYWSKIA